jgi:hypothetical protein
MILGIDAGSSTTALCILDKGKILYQKTMTIAKAMEAIEKMHCIYHFEHAIVEMPSESLFYARHWTDKRGNPIGERVKQKILINAGENRQCAKQLVEKLESFGVKVKKQQPTRGTTKWSESYWRSVFKYEGRISSHARDAAILALTNECWYGTFKIK